MRWDALHVQGNGVSREQCGKSDGVARYMQGGATSSTPAAGCQPCQGSACGPPGGYLSSCWCRRLPVPDLGEPLRFLRFLVAEEELPLLEAEAENPDEEDGELLLLLAGDYLTCTQEYL